MSTASPVLADLDPRRDLVVVIMAGGAGTRFWPASTESTPKQFLRFFGERSLLQQSYDRVVSLVGEERIFVLTNERFVPLVTAQLPSLPRENVIGEPARRDTAAAVALAALLAARRFRDPIIATLTSDHLIEPAGALQAALVSAARGARASGALYTFGIAPDHPATGYGYLEVGEPLVDDDGVAHLSLERIVEKPELARATAFVAGGRHLWNSGMFVWSASAILGELERQLPKHLALLRPAVEADGTVGFAGKLAAAFEPLDRVSIDYGVMENAELVRCCRGQFAWSDVGGFPALAEHLSHDERSNAHRGSLCALEAERNLVFCEDEGEQVALLGVSDLLVVRAGKRTLVMPRARAEEIKRLIPLLPESER
ncbi:MAG: mannose-1-phosphate guanylyltransferase [Myxococcota bacterium]